MEDNQLSAIIWKGLLSCVALLIVCASACTYAGNRARVQAPGYRFVEVKVTAPQLTIETQDAIRDAVEHTNP